MRIAFYAPLKSPAHATPSGDRTVARLYWQALERAGHQVRLASSLRAYDGAGDPARQCALRDEAQAEAARLIDTWSAGPAADRPELWFTYHAYYKSPDWIGPDVAQALGIPYVLAEASCAGKRAQGSWALGHAQTVRAVRAAALLISPTAHDLGGLRATAGDAAQLVQLPPFLELPPPVDAADARRRARAALAARCAIDASVPWLAAVGMMRPGDKLASYRALSQALVALGDRDWRLLVAGDGVERAAVQAALDAAAPGRVHYLGHCDASGLTELYKGADLCVWPAVNEAYGMALLEAQAHGLPVVACATRGVVDVVADGVGGLLAPEGRMDLFAEHIRTLLDNPARRSTMATAARQCALEAHGLDGAARRLDGWLGALRAGMTA